MSEVAQLEREKRRALNKNNLREVANLCNLLGQELQKIGDHEGALEQHREEGALCEDLDDVVGKAVSHRRMGEVYCDMGNWKHALNHQNKHLSLAKEAGSLVEEQRAYATIGRTHLQQSEDLGSEEEKERALNEAEQAFKKALIACQSLKGEVATSEHCQMRCRLYLNLGLVLDLRGNSRQARDFINQAIDLCTNQNFHDDAHRCHVALGGIMLREGLLPQALQEGQKALSLAGKLRDKALICEGHVFLAQIHLQNSNFESAKKCFYKAYKLKHPDLSSRSQIEGNLKSVVNICSAEDQLVTLGDNGGERSIKLYEKLGDKAADLCLYKQAVSYYHKMLNSAISLDKGPSVLAPAYLSLARTYSDMKQYKESKEFYQKEFKIRLLEDYGEACKTLLNIAVVSEELGEEINQLNELYKQARELSIKAKNPKLEAYILIQHTSLKGLTEEKIKLKGDLRRIIEDNNFDSDIELSEDEDSEEDMDLDLIHFSDSEEENELDRPRHTRQKRSLVVKRNEKGETPLHKACIDGNLPMVKKLLFQGHPVNPRDNCGWLPLHEASNHGYCEIVEVLLDSGAWISDRGGAQCDGVTPLHDAAGAGNFEVIKLLISRGASVTAKTDEGDTPLECLVKFRLRSDHTSSDHDECRRLENELKEKMEQAGHNIPTLPADRPNNTHSINQSVTKKPNRRERMNTGRERMNTGRERMNTGREKLNTGIERMNTGRESEKKTLSSRNSIDLGSDEDEDKSSTSDIREIPSPIGGNARDDFSQENSDTDDLLNPLLEELQKEEKSATSSYLSAMDCVGSGARRAVLNKSSKSLGSTKDKKVALVSEFDVGDNWLDDDLGMFTKKRKRERFEFDYKEPRKERSSVNSFSHNSQSERFNKEPRNERSSISSSSHNSQSERFTKEPRKESSIRSVSSISSRSLSSKKVRQPTITSILNKYPESEESGEYSTPISTPRGSTWLNEYTEIGTESGSTVRRNSSEFNGNSGDNIANSNIAVGALRLKVRVQDRLLLVPIVDQKLTVGWLAEEVTRRYYQLSGLRPQLTLATQDGALLDTSDPIALVLPAELKTGTTELIGQVKSWDLPPLTERYSQACQALGTTPIPFLTSMLQNTHVSTTLNLDSAGYLTHTELQPCLRALQYQNSLRSLSLSSCRLGDEGFNYLLEALPTLSTLDSLNLTSSSITTISFLKLTSAISSGKLSLTTLCSLDLSYNNFAGVKLSNIIALFNLPALNTLSLKHCYLSLNEQMDSLNSGATSSTTPNLQNLSLDYNTVCGSSLSSILLCLPNLTSLKLSGLKKSPVGQIRIGAALSKLLGSGEECRLTFLDLSYCDLVDFDLDEISAYLYRCPHLTSINLAHNPSLTTNALSNLLTELTNNLILPVSSLSLHGNKMSGLEDKIISTLKHKAATNHSLTSLSYTSMLDTRVEDTWKSQYQNKSLVKRIANEVLLSTESKS